MDKVVHFEVPTKDLERAKKFYGEVFGWQMIPMEEMNYTVVRTAPTDDDNMITEPGAINGGLTVDDPTAEGPVLVINVESIDAKLEEAKAAGATVVLEKITVGDMGLYARIKDPEGNVIGVWEDIKKS